MQTVEHRGCGGDPLLVAARDGADPIDRASHTRRLIASELAVAEIEIVEDLSDRGECGIVEAHALEQHFKAAAISNVGELGVEHVEPQLTVARRVPLRRYE